MPNPYTALGPRAFWRTGVVENHALHPQDLYRKKFDIAGHERIATAGSCFAQHIAGRLRSAGYQVLDTEPAPVGLDRGIANDYGFGLYSARYGNVYTVRQMLQLVQECDNLRSPVDPVWERGGRYYDALRPSVEPLGLISPEAVLRHRRQHLDCLRGMLDQVDLFVFTFGLTEAWVHAGDETVYPTVPGAVAGAHDPATYVFRNFTFNEILDDFVELRQRMRQHSADLRFVLTVSPVPLTATAGHEHVLAATTYSKSVLRAVAGQLATAYPDIDYFPSYEIIAGIPARSVFYESNLRSISPAGVDVVMRAFFEQHGAVGGGDMTAEDATMEVRSLARDMARINAAQRVVCEESLLETFA